ncbi:complement resistance protein TraT [Candidatus Bandiella euplotis]|nr:complement resistance protein TraT [Candidatus Bandiella woodruffii]
MNKKISSYVIIFLLSLAVFNLTGCGTTQKLIKHGKLEVQTKMSDTVFLDPIDDDKKTVILQIRNTTDKEGLDIEAQIKSAIEAKGAPSS